MKNNVLDYRKSYYSTIGNDGIIEYILDMLNIRQGFFVEFGAWDGIKGSNCRRLFENQWGGIFLEKDKVKFSELEINYRGCSDILCINNSVETKGKNLFDNILDRHSIDREIDFCSIDIDGMDLAVFETFVRSPKVICIEGGQMLEPFHKRIPDNIASKNIQQSLSIMCDSFYKKGYRLLCSYQDSFFVQEKYYDYFGVSEDLVKHYFMGLRAIPRRMPFIQSILRKNGIKNHIVDLILKKSCYKRYGYKNRKKWADEESEIIINSINKVQKEYYKK